MRELEGRITVSGMFRSGTTLLSRMLGANGENLVVSDPLVYFFKAYRNLHLEAVGARGWHPDEPTCDAFRPRFPAANAAIRESYLSEPVPAKALRKFREDLRLWKGEQHPRLCEHLDRIDGTSFAELYANTIDLLVELYGGPETRRAGVKVSWCEEYLPALARAFPSMRFLLVVRDPRAVVASQNSQSIVGVGKRPLLFYVRHWRKSVAYAHLFARHDPWMRERVHIVRYEDLVRRPESVLREACDFLGARYGSEMLEPGHYRDLDESGVWTPNSAFDKRGAELYLDSIERWRRVLSPDEVRAIESLAGPELVSMGYSLTEHPLDPISCLELDCEPQPDELAPWIRPFACCDYLEDTALRLSEYAWEERRRALIEGAGVFLPGEEDLVLDPRVLEDLRAAWAPVSRAA